jgi:hypothetical protein
MSSMSTVDTAPITWHTNPAGHHLAATPDYDLYVFPGAPSATPFVWNLDTADGRPLASGEESSLAGATAEVVKAYSDRRPESYALRTVLLFSDQPFGPQLDLVTLDEATTRAVAYTEEHKGVESFIYDPQGRVLTTVQDGVLCSP